MNKGTVSEKNIHIYCDKHKQILTEMDNTYRCMRTLKITAQTNTTHHKVT